MSLAGVFGSAGISIGVTVGGVVLSSSGFQILGLVLGSIGVFSAVVVFFFAREPIKLQ